MGAIIRIGPLGIPAILLFLLISYGIASFVLFLLKWDKTAQKIIKETASGAMFVALVVWKISPLLTNFAAVAKEPLSLLYLPGNSIGTLLAVLAGVGYITVKVIRQKENRRSVIKGLCLLFGTIILFTALSMTIYSAVNKRDSVNISTEHEALILPDTENRSVNLSKMADQIVVLNFWATWCPPCRAEIPELNSFFRSETASKVHFYGINLSSTEESTKKVAAFLEEYEIKFPVLSDKSGKTAAFFRIQSVPTTIIFHRGNEIIRYEGAVSEGILVNKIKTLLNSTL